VLQIIHGTRGSATVPEKLPPTSALKHYQAETETRKNRQNKYRKNFSAKNHFVLVCIP
jgi:hypothetical protein